ncbi:DUF6586 family protein [Marinobacter koreensis]|uniref:DUF6586 family protein n=1 Tax=Marinobacter koreensis TaxID=335974 RepID=A0ABW0RIV7_9GAMM|nr:DUF6586 family protein [Marinobacter sp.]
MASQWYSLVSQKLFLAQTLLGQLEPGSRFGTGESMTEAEKALNREAATQGAVELMLRGRQLLLVLVANLYQHRHAQPESLSQLQTLTGPENQDVQRLAELAAQPGSWWSHLDQLEYSQGHPPVTRKTVSDENIIAVAAEPGPDRSPSGLMKTLEALRHFAEALNEQHSEW